MKRFAKATGFSLLAMLALALPVQAQANVAGEWTLNLDGPDGPATITAVFAQDGQTVTGALELPMVGGSEMSDGMIEGNKLTFLLHVDFDGQWFTLEVQGEVDGDTIEGDFVVPEMGAMPFRGKRTDG